MMNPAARSRAISSPIASLLSLLKRRRNFLIGFIMGSMLRWCSASSLGTPGMSEGFHAKDVPILTDELDEHAFLFVSHLPMMNCFEESPRTKSTFLVSSAG